MVLFTNVWVVGAGGDTVSGRSMESVGWQAGSDAIRPTERREKRRRQLNPFVFSLSRGMLLAELEPALVTYGLCLSCYASLS